LFFSFSFPLPQFIFSPTDGPTRNLLPQVKLSSSIFHDRVFSAPGTIFDPAVTDNIPDIQSPVPPPGPGGFFFPLIDLVLLLDQAYSSPQDKLHNFLLEAMLFF